jgi:hypothetical protein
MEAVASHQLLRLHTSVTRRFPTTLGRRTVSLDDAQSFKNGEYVTIFHAGPPCRLAIPNAPIVSPSVNAGGRAKGGSSL